MAATTRDRALDAAVEVLGAEGVRALTHARVDARAGLPPGSTSNWFRTRRALIAGVLDRIGEREQADLDPSQLPLPRDPGELIEAFVALLELQSGSFALRTRARYALFLELATDSELAAPLHRDRREFERLTERLVASAGIVEVVPTARALMALGDGLLFHRLTVDPALELRPPIERVVRALVAHD
ncbi:TetR/AcrR family transcriptional regulator [Agromyces sp. NPDC058126]|uniref:TetR/AcrR family transcriptional regulator n=1 Tax=Agromyces sp. NPDC058126 TaxID=3346350 RepID=UPI0036D9A858